MDNTNLTKIKGQTPISIIVHGGNYTSFLLAKTLLEQGSHVVIIDKYTNSSKQYFTDLKKTGKVSFIDFKGLKSFYEKIARIDYLYYMLGQKVEDNGHFDSKDFLAETDYLNSSLTAANKYKAKISLVTSMRLNRELANRVNNEVTGKTKPYSPLELQRYGENFAAEFVDKTKANLRIIRLGTLLGKRINNITDSILDKLFTDSTQKHQIEIEGEGLELHNLIHESDAIYGILKLTFTDDTKGEVISLCNRNDYSTLSLAYKLLELDVEARAIKFVEKQSTDTVLQDLYVPAPNAEQFGWKQNVSLEESIIEQIQAYYEKSDKKWDADKVNNIKKYKAQDNIATTSKTKLGRFVYNITAPFRKLGNPKDVISTLNYTTILRNITITSLSLLVIYFLIAPIIGITLGSALIYKDSKTLRDSLEELNFDKLQQSTSNISSNISRVENNLNRIYWVFKLTNGVNEYRNINQIVEGTGYAMDSAQDLVVGLRPLGEYIKDFEPAVGFGEEKQNSREYTEYLKAIDDNQYSVKEGIYKMSLAQNLIDSVDTKDIPKFLQEYVLQYKDLINDVNTTVKPLEKVTQFLPDLLGVNERKRYLILTQNEGEIRSTGGWISTYAIVAIEGGQIREMFVDDIYNGDGALKLQGVTHKTPNSMIRALADVPYTFSLVNWDPNLDNVMLSAEQFIYDLGKGNEIDGLITMDTLFLEKLLDKWEGIEVPGETELITSSNLYTKIFEMQTEFIPTSTRKSIFLTDLTNEILTKVLSSKLVDYRDIGDILEESLTEKHIQVTFKNSTAKSYTDSMGWDGNIDSKYQNTPVNIDWNWGANKANLYIKKNHTLDIDIKDENTIDYKYQIAIQNDSTSNEFPQGEYVNYVRVLLPSSANIMSIKGLKDNKYDVYNEYGYKVVGGWFNTPIKETSTLEISYRILRDESGLSFPLVKTDTHFDMDINIYKQPGSKKDAYNLSLKFPETWEIEESEGMTRIENNVNRRLELSSDQYFNLSWKR